MPDPMPIVDWMVREKTSGPSGATARPAALFRASRMLVAAGFVGDRLVDGRFGEDLREHEPEHAGDESGQRATQNDADFHGRVSAAGQWQGKPRKCRESCTHSWMTMLLPNREVMPSSTPTK